MLVRLAGIEPATLGLEGRCSIQLSYRRAPRLSLLTPREATAAGLIVPEIVPAQLSGGLLDVGGETLLGQRGPRFPPCCPNACAAFSMSAFALPSAMSPADRGVRCAAP
jgi:hypothetical protein